LAAHVVTTARATKKTKDVILAYAYTRISKDRVGAGLGVERQLKDIRKLAAVLSKTLGKQVVIVEVFSDNDIGASSLTKKKRKDYPLMLEGLAAGRAQLVLAWHTDRLHRTVGELLDYITVCQPLGVDTYCFQAGHLDLGNADGRMKALLGAVIAAHFTDHMSEQIRAQKLDMLMKGEWIGGAPPFGYRSKVERNRHGDVIRVELVVAEAEKDLIQDAAARVLAGESLYAICKGWTEAGVLMPRGSTQWLPATLKRILINPRYARVVAHHGTVLEGVVGRWPEIIAPDVHSALVARLSEEERRSYDGSRSLKWLGTNLYVCEECGSLMRSAGVSSVGSDGQKHAAYRCKGGLHLSIRAAPVDEMVKVWVGKRLMERGKDLIDRTADKETIARLHERINALGRKYDQIGRMFDDDKIDEAEYLRRRAANQAKLAEVTAEMEACSVRSVLLGVADALDPVAAFMAAPIERRRAIVDMLCTVTIRKGKRGRPGPGVDPFEWRVTITPKDGTPTAQRLRQRAG
jgi:DNA invertase Pin-like site-specific DNA recombinase